MCQGSCCWAQLPSQYGDMAKQTVKILTYFVTYVHEFGVSFNQGNTPESVYHTCVTVEAFFS